MKKLTILIFFISFAVVLSLTMLSCAQKGKEESKGDVEFSSDQQNVTIGKQVWMTRNLDVSTFRNGDSIPEAKTKGEWKAYSEANEAAWCYYKNDPGNGAQYGKLYNWYAVSDPRGLAPKGWHIASDMEWTILVDYLDEKQAGWRMKSREGWYDDGNGTNSSGFSSLPGGYRASDGKFYSIGELGGWWSSTEFDTGSSWYRNMTYDDGIVNGDSGYKGGGLSVRCLRD